MILWVTVTIFSDLFLDYSAMIIKYKNYSNGVHNIAEELPVVHLGLPENFHGIISVNCRMDKSQHQIVLNCDVKCEAELLCDRCNSQYNSVIRTNFLITCFFEEREDDENDINLKFLTVDQDKIDLSEEIREYMLLAVPMKNLCNEDCKGLCTKCGINLNESTCGCPQEKIDSVWEPLKKLKDNLK